ncbi:hypothetical protein [Brevundimonas subvibrioides]|uniref:Uncharacterized protein n=1 Tax=Brevundimonas subvibrioides (strain ATCC 15264 / DSM 4735 / LMG 14903 / NBRC 16000 / CB 81) TaxID=633149 RepID=D9QHU2_BRESC|nr:hypothetical protein [Brevundimonas subvibrioides]ADK99367.1 hypothetical protein Bresu_0052 [Brevundimonas subvibrioides ATCC 15264]
MTSLLTGIIAAFRTFPLRSWLILAAVAALLTLGAWLYFAGREDERDDQADRQARVEAKASAGRETAATERTLDTTAIQARQAERDHAAEALPDSAPDERDLRRRCRQLRDAGLDPAACRGLEGPG